MPYSSEKLMQMVLDQTTDNLRTMLAAKNYTMLGKSVGDATGFICQILRNDRSYFLMVRFEKGEEPLESQLETLWMEINLYLPVWVPYDKRKRVAEFLSAQSAGRFWGRLGIDERGMVRAFGSLSLNSYHCMLEELMEGEFDNSLSETLLVEEALPYCAPSVKALKAVERNLQSLLFDNEERILSMVYPGASIKSKSGSRQQGKSLRGGYNEGLLLPFPDSLVDVLVQFSVAWATELEDLPARDDLLKRFGRLARGLNEEELERVKSRVNAEIARRSKD